MGKSKKPKPAVAEEATTPSSPSVDPNLALFASYVADDRKKAQAAKRAAKEERRQAQEAQNLVETKDRAAAEVKRLRGRESATTEERAAADIAYREALAAVVAAETGETPTWAPEPASEPEPEPEPASESGSESPAVDAEDATP